MKKINVITLGCSKNTVDSEHLMARLAAAGYEVLFDSDRTDAKVVVINTCGFIGDAKQESVDMILRAAAAKNAGKIERLFVIGCLSERYADSLRAELPEVDGFFGARTWDGIARALGAAEDPALATERHLSTPRHYAYLRISRVATGNAATAPFRSSAAGTFPYRWRNWRRRRANSRPEA